MPKKAEAPSEALSRQLADTRNARGWSQHRLAAELEDIGSRLGRGGISKLELGTPARGVSLDEAFHLAAALQVSPSALFLPREASGRVSVAPELIVSSGDARRWIAGRAPLPGHDERTYFQVLPEEAWATATQGGVLYLLQLVEDLVAGLSLEDEDATATALEDLADEIERQQRRLEREMARKPKREKKQARTKEAGRGSLGGPAKKRRDA